MNTASSSSNDFTNYKKPWFTIEFKTKPIGVDIRLNDIPIFNIDNTGFMTLEIPVNEYIINGDNEIKVTTHPLFDDNEKQVEDYSEGSSIEIYFYVREDDEPSDKRKLINQITIHPQNAYLKESKEPVATLKYSERTDHILQPPVVDGETLSFPGKGIYKKQVITSLQVKSIKTHFPRWNWQDGLQITDNEDSFKSILQAYKKLHIEYNNKNIDAVQNIAKSRSTELATAYYLENEQAGFEYSAMSKHIDNDEVKLYPELFMGYMQLEILANGKLARIMNRAHTHPILFVNYETEQIYNYQFMWYLNKNSEWILIR